MVNAINYAVLGLCIAAIGLLVRDIVRGDRARGLFLIGALIVFVIVLALTTGFPFNSGRVAFGGGIPTLWGIVAMFVCIVLGCLAQAVWSAGSGSTWLDYIKPIVVSPILLLPLLASLPQDGIEPVQLVAVAILAFQNGFFWQQVLKDAKPTTASNSSSS